MTSKITFGHSTMLAKVLSSKLNFQDVRFFIVAPTSSGGTAVPVLSVFCDGIQHIHLVSDGKLSYVSNCCFVSFTR